MAVTLTVNGVSFSYPQTGDTSWGSPMTGWASAVTSGMLQKAGGSFILTAEIDFGGSFGLKSLYFKSRTSNPSTTGQIRLGNTDAISWRNAGNSANLALTADSSNNLTYNGHIITASTGAGAANTVSVSDGTSPSWAKIVNANVDAAAAITYSKLSLTGGILNADVNASAAIARSKIAAAGNNNSVAFNNGSGALTSDANLGWDGTTLSALLAIQLNHAATSAAVSEIYNGVTDGAVIYQGGSGSSNSGQVACYGSTHATLANTVDVRSGSTVLARFNANGLGLLSGAATSTAPLAIQKSADALVQAFLYNSNAGSSAVSRFSIRTNADDFDMSALSTAAGASVTLNSGSGFTNGLILAQAGAYPVTVKNNSAVTAVFNTNGLAILSGSTSSTTPLSVRKDANALVRGQITNGNSGASASAELSVTSDAGDVDLIAQSTNTHAAFLNIGSGFTSGFTIDQNGANPVFVKTNSTVRLTISSAGSVVAGSAAISTSATDGFVYIPSCAGTPSGTPTSFSGRTPLVYDTTADKLWVYNSSWHQWGAGNNVLNYITKTANFTLTSANDVVGADASGGGFTLTLPTSVGNDGKVFHLKKIESSTNTVTVATTSSQTIDGSTTQYLSTQDDISVLSDGANWRILSRKIDRGLVVGTAQTSAGTTTSASYAATSNSITVTVTPLRTSTWRIGGSFQCAHSGSVGDTSYLRVIASSGSPTVVFSQEGGFQQETSNQEVATMAPYTLVTLTANTAYTFRVEGKTTAGTLTIRNNGPTGGHALVAQEIT